MKTYPIINESGNRLPAFEIENAYIGPAAISKLLGSVDGVTDVQQRKMFAKSADVHVNFKYCGQPYIVWEPFGDNSRYWIGPDDQEAGTAAVADTTHLENAFNSYRPPLYRAVLGDLLSLQFIARFIKPREK